MIDIKLVGPWTATKVALLSLPDNVKASATWGQRKASESLVKIVKKHINSQDLGWQARSVKTNSNDPRVLVDTEAYYSNIKAWKKGDTYFAGVPHSATNGEGKNIAHYAAINEVGGGDLPARPLWAPSLKELGGKKGIRKIVTNSIFSRVSKLRALGFTVRLNRI